MSIGITYDRSGAKIGPVTGAHAVQWDGRDASGRRVSAGLYLYQLFDTWPAAATQGYGSGSCERRAVRLF
ncbi:MAG: hypothetical protein O2954_08070 [bacterium]|nr:hypothetical protein [bacterium]